MRKAYLQLGRTGDLMTLLPLLWKDAQSGERPLLMVSSEFSPVLDGVSYVEPVIFQGPYYELGKAAEEFEAKGHQFICTQVNGPVPQVREFTYLPAKQESAVCTSYQKEMWKVAGRLKEWDRMYPLVFDRRDKARETKLLIDALGKKRGKRRRFILLATGGTSSPFANAEVLRELVRFKLGKRFDIVDLSSIQAERIYDFLTLYEQAHCLISTDSAPLHLARACPALPVIALTNDKPLLWNGSSWMPNHVFYCRYSDFTKRAKEMLGVIENPPSLEPPDEPQVIHVWNGYEAAGQEERITPGWMDTRVELGACGRDSAINLKDPKRIPYLKDCLRMGLQRARDCDFVVVTRPDTKVIDGAGAELLAHEASYCYRLNRSEPGLETHAPIVDLFCARKPWWTAHLDNIPDFVFGSDYFWSHGLFALFMKNGAALLHGIVYRNGK